MRLPDSNYRLSFDLVNISKKRVVVRYDASRLAIGGHFQIITR